MKAKDSILYIDDEEFNLMLFEAAFTENFNVHSTNSTSKASEILNKEPIKVAICDLSMPLETGLEFISSVGPYIKIKIR